MDTDLNLLTALLLDPFLTTEEARRQVAATPRRPAPGDGSPHTPRSQDFHGSPRRPATTLEF